MDRHGSFIVKIQSGLNFYLDQFPYLPFPFRWDLDGIYGLMPQERYSGYLRAAAVIEGVGGSISVLDDHADRIPVGGVVSAEVEGDEAVMTFQWLTEGTGNRLLMMAQPHHMDTLVLDSSYTSIVTSHSVQGLKGQLLGISSESAWQFIEPLTTIAWDSVSPVSSEGDVEIIKTSLEYDIANEPLPADDPYFGGKKMAVFARLSLIAEQIGEMELAKQAREKVLIDN